MPTSADADLENHSGPELFISLDEAAAAAYGNDPVKDVAPAPSDADHRRAKRQRVLKLAQLVFGTQGSIIDCLIIDESRFGVMLETHTTTDVPERVKIRLIGGRTFDAMRRWASGNRVGLEFVGSFVDDAATQRRIRAIRNALQDLGVHAAVQMLREADFLGNAEMRSAAEAAEIAIARLESVLI